MKKITVNTNNPEIVYKMIIPENYEKIPLPYFKEWTKALDSESYSQAKGQLCEIIPSIKGEVCCFCCLGILSEIQGRLTEDGRDGDSDSLHYLSSSNPNFSVFGNMGKFPKGIIFLRSEFVTKIESLSHLNDIGVPFLEISKVIKEIWKEESLDNA